MSLDLDVGEMTERVALYETTSDNEPRLGALETAVAGEPYARRWCKIVPGSARELRQFAGQEAFVDYTLTMRLLERARTSHVVTWRGTTYQITVAGHDRAKRQTVLGLRAAEGA